MNARNAIEFLSFPPESYMKVPRPVKPGSLKLKISLLVLTLTLVLFALGPSRAGVAFARSPVQAGDDFQTLCSAPGVIKCVGFDSATDIAGTDGNPSGIEPGSQTTPQIDSTVSASGAGSLMFTIPSGAAAGSSGAYFTNFSNDLSTQFGANSEFYVQWKQRFSPEFLSYSDNSGDGWKQFLVGPGDQQGTTYFTCTDSVIVTENVYYRGFAQMYDGCASNSTSHPAFDNFDQPYGPFDWKLQNGVVSPYCLYSQFPNYFPPYGNCSGYFPNEWMTFEIHVKTGPRVNDEFVNSFIQLWIAREGQAPQLAIDWGPYNLTAGAPALNEMFGKVWFLPYNTTKDPIVSPVMYTWYDSLVISTQAININGSVPPVATPAPPIITNVAPAGITNLTATITWTTDQPTDSEVDYGTTASYGQSTTDVSLVRAHSVNLSGLSPGTMYHFRVSSENAANDVTTSGDYTFTTAGQPSITLAPTTLPNGGIGTAYHAALIASGGFGSYTFTFLSGALPAGLVLDPTGAIYGTPTTMGTANFTAQAQDSVGNTGSSAFTLTISSSIPPDDFQTICSAPGVLKCVGFDSQADVAGTDGNISGIEPGPQTSPQIDFAVGASGAGSLKFTIPSGAGAGSSGAYFTNFSNDLSTQFGANSEFYVQWKQRFSPEFLSYIDNDGDGWKQSIVGPGDQPGGVLYFTCTDLALVTQNLFYRGFEQIYDSCTGSSSHGPFDAFAQPLGNSNWELQNARPSPSCLYSQTPNFFPPNGNCFGYFANEWMTFEIHVKTGPRGSNFVPGASPNDEFVNSYIQLWIAREGQAPQMVINWGPYNLTAGSPAANEMFGKMWLLPYNTHKDTISSPVMYTWYDSLVISSQPITINSSTLPPPPPPNIGNIASSNVTNRTATLTWTTDQPADSEVNYGIGSDYGQNVSSPSLVTVHSVSLSNLSASTTYHFSITSTNSGAAATTTQDVTFTTASPPSISASPSALPAAAVGVVYSQTISESGGYPPYTFSVMTGSLPGGLTLDPSSGIISGVPVAVGSVGLTVQATDAAGNSNNTSYTLNVTDVVSSNVSISQLVPTFSGETFGDFAGQITLNLKMTNIGPAITSGLYFQVVELRKLGTDQAPGFPDILLSADNMYGSVGDTQTVPVNSLASNQTIPLSFSIGLGSRQTFQFFADLYTGTPPAPSGGNIRVARNGLEQGSRALAHFRFDISATEPDSGSGASTTASTPANVGVITGPGPQSRPSVAVDPLVPTRMAVASNDYLSRTVRVSTSQDGGQTWNSASLSRTVLNQTFFTAQTPSLAFDSFGRLSVVYTLSDLNDSANAIVLTESTDLLNFNPPTAITFHTADGIIDSRPAIAIKSGVGRYVAWDSLTIATFRYSIEVARSEEGGLFGPMTTVASNGQISSAALALSANRVYLGWDDWGFNSIPPYRTGGRLMLSSSAPGPQLNFGVPGQIVATSIGAKVKIPAMPDYGAAPNLGLAADPKQDGLVYAVYADQGKGLDIRLARSADWGASWQIATANNDSTMADQFSPAIAVDSNGYIDITFDDTRLSTTFQTADVFLARSSTGITFDNQRITTVSSNDSRTNPFRDFTADLGDRTAIAVTSNNTVVAAWTDTRSGSEDIFLAVAPENQPPSSAVPQVAWNTPGSIMYGTVLGAAQLNASASVPGTFAFNPPAGTILDKGVHTLSLSFTPSDTEHFLSATASVQILVQPAPLTVTAAPWSRPYGSANPAMTGSIVGEFSGDNITAAYSTSATAGSPPGIYSITPVLVDPNNRLFNYTVSMVNGVLNVQLASLTVTAVSSSRLYGSANPPLTVSIAGVVNGDNISATCTTGATSSSVVGKYPITPVISDPDNRLSNYTVNIVGGLLNVQPAPLTVTAASASRLYGSANPPLAVSVNGAVNGDAIIATGTTGATIGSAVGKYSITPAISDPNSRISNYTVTAISGTLNVLPAPLVATANPASRFYGSANPALTGSLTGVVNGDNITSTFITTATVSSMPGNYSITPVLNDPNNRLSNYNVTLTNAVLTVVPAPIITLSATSLQFGSQDLLSISKALTLTVGNIGNADLAIGSVVLGGVNANEFQLANNCGQTVAAGNNCVINVTLTPLALHGRSGIITLTDNTGGYAGSQQVVNLSGNGVLSYALYSTSMNCGAVQLSGNASIDSFDSVRGSYASTKSNQGNIGVNGNITLSGNATVNGTIYALKPAIGDCKKGSAGITTSGKAQMTGSPAYGQLVPDIFTTPGMTPGTSNIDVKANAALMPGNYGNITAEAKATLALSSGTYNINSLKLSGDAKITVTGPVTLNVAGTNQSTPLDFGGGSVVDPSGKPANILIVYTGNGQIQLTGQEDSFGILYAPNADVKLSGQGDWYGAVVANTLEGSGNSSIHYDVNLGQ